VNYGALFRSALVALLRNKMRSILTVLGITIGIAAVICVVAIGNAGQARVQQQLNNLGDNFVFVLTAYLLITEAIGTYIGVHFLWVAKESSNKAVKY
jgi:ABC-type antimicrobial peptide transport system permease subunit